MNRILERLSDQLSIRQSEQGHGTTPSDPSHRDPDRPLRQTRTGPVSNTHSSAEDQSESDQFDDCESAFSRLIGKASDMGSSQVFDQSGVLEVTRSTGDGGFGVCVCVCVCVL